MTHPKTWLVGHNAIGLTNNFAVLLIFLACITRAGLSVLEDRIG